MLTAESGSLRQRVSVELQETCDFTTKSLLNEVRAFLSILSTYEENARGITTEQQRGHWAGKVLGRSLVIPTADDGVYVPQEPASNAKARGRELHGVAGG